MNALLVDLGNSALKWVEHGAGVVWRPAQAPVDDALDVVLDRCWHPLRPPACVWVGSVRGADDDARLARWVAAHWGCRLEFARSSTRALGVVNAYPEPGRLGVDRWLTLIATHRLLPGRRLIVDSGSATTLDLLDGDGRHRGGLILPGLAMMRRALLGGTALPPADPDAAIVELADHTDAAIASGALLATVALIERARRRPETGPAAVVLTGGAAPLLSPRIAEPVLSHPDLVLRGLQALCDAKEE